MTAHLLAPPERRWECPSCDLQDVTHETRPHARMHSCAGLGGLTVPMVPAGVRAEHRLVEREDYVGREQVQLHEGRPVMNVTTIRDEGQDCTVYAPSVDARLSVS
ncbi:hypothetical protein ACIBCH_20605 [Amycolatopsis thailandensis]|uniref:hypothetical protein n=1 Tax=Amycolatopsis thailandensis TaxID=589330 RepID=UPI00379AD4CE